VGQPAISDEEKEKGANSPFYRTLWEEKGKKLRAGRRVPYNDFHTWSRGMRTILRGGGGGGGGGGRRRGRGGGGGEKKWFGSRPGYSASLSRSEQRRGRWVAISSLFGVNKKEREKTT